VAFIASNEAASDEATEMNVTYRLSKQDYTAYIKFVQRRVCRLARIPLSWRAVAWVLLVPLFVLVIRLLETDLIRELLPVSVDTSFAAFVAIVFVGYFVFYFKTLNKRIISMMVTEGGPFLGDFSLEWVSDGFVVRGQHTKTKFDWDAIQAVEENEGYIFILIDNAAGLVIPKSAFSLPQEKQYFLETFASKIRG
jgi:hypothetical protein